MRVELLGHMVGGGETTDNNVLPRINHMHKNGSKDHPLRNWKERWEYWKRKELLRMAQGRGALFRSQALMPPTSFNLEPDLKIKCCA